MIVILGDMQDSQVKAVLPEIEKLGVGARLIDHRAPTRLSARLGPDEEVILVDGEPIGPTDLIWYRFKVPVPPFPSSAEARNAYAIGMAWRSALTNLCAHFEDRVVNTLASTVLNHQRLWQLPIARACGFRIPSSQLSNDFEDVVGFSAANPSVIVKALSDAVVPEDGGGRTQIMTMRVDKGQLAQAEAGVRVAPILYQEEIPKAHELRVVVYGDSVLPFRVDSQAHRQTSVDWRHGNTWLPFEPCTLPEDLMQSIRRFMRRARLFEGQFDFIVTPGGEYVFLECNPQGNWRWLEKFCDGEISRSAAAALCLQAERLERGAKAPRVGAEG